MSSYFSSSLRGLRGLLKASKKASKIFKKHSPPRTTTTTTVVIPMPAEPSSQPQTTTPPSSPQQTTTPRVPRVLMRSFSERISSTAPALSVQPSRNSICSDTSSYAWLELEGIREVEPEITEVEVEPVQVVEPVQTMEEIKKDHRKETETAKKKKKQANKKSKGSGGGGGAGDDDDEEYHCSNPLCIARGKTQNTYTNLIDLKNHFKRNASHVWFRAKGLKLVYACPDCSYVYESEKGYYKHICNGKKPKKNDKRKVPVTINIEE